MNKDNEVVYPYTGKVNLGEKYESKAVSSYAVKQVEAAGYKIKPASQSEYTLLYDRANHVVLKDEQGNVLQTATSSDISTYMEFTVTVGKVFTVTTSGDGHVTVDESGEGFEGDDYTVNFEAEEGYAVTGVIVDGEALSEEELSTLEGAYTFKALDADHTLAVETKKLHQVVFKAGANGSLTDTEEVVYTDVIEGTQVAVPGIKAEPGYKFAGWFNAQGQKVELGEKAEVNADMSYTAEFEADTYTITFQVKDSKGAVIEKSDVYSENKDAYTVVATFTYNKDEQIKFPSVTLEDGFESFGWKDDATGELVNAADFTPVADASYSLMVGTKTTRSVKLSFVDRKGNVIHTSADIINLDEEKPLIDDEVLAQIEASGYVILPVAQQKYVLLYDDVNHAVLKDENGRTVQEGSIDEEGSFTFDVDVARICAVKVLGDDHAVIEGDSSSIEGEDYTIHFSAEDGYVITGVTVDGKALTPEEIKALNGAYTFTNLSEDHSFAVSTKKLHRVEFYAAEGSLIVDGDETTELIYTEVIDGDSVAVPEVKALAGYTFAAWTDSTGRTVELDKQLEVTKDEVYTASFKASTFAVTFQVENNEGATLTKNGGYVDNVDEFTVKGLFTYDPDKKIEFPTVLVKEGYQAIGWRDEATGEIVEAADFTPASDVTYTLVTKAADFRCVVLKFVDENGKAVFADYLPQVQVFLNESVNAVDEEVLAYLKEAGYQLEPENQKDYVIAYEKANYITLDGKAIETVNAEGNLEAVLVVSKVKTPDKPDDNKPDDNQPDDNKPDDNKPDDNKPDDNQPTDNKPDDNKQDGSKPGSDKPDDGKKDENTKETEQKATEKTEAVKTGDTTNIELYVIMLLAAILLLGAGVYGKKRKTYSKK